MKLRRFVVFSSIFCVVGLVYSCKNNSDSARIVERKWGIDTFYSEAWEAQLNKLKHMIDTAKNNNVKYALAQSVESSLKQQKQETIQFNPDSSLDEFVVMMNTPINLKGSWKLVDDDKMVISIIPQKKTIKVTDSTSGTLTVGEDQKSDTFKIAILNADKLMLIGNGKKVWNGTIVLKPVK